MNEYTEDPENLELEELVERIEENEVKERLAERSLPEELDSELFEEGEFAYGFGPREEDAKEDLYDENNELGAPHSEGSDNYDKHVLMYEELPGETLAILLYTEEVKTDTGSNTAEVTGGGSAAEEYGESMSDTPDKGFL